jgi:hypothetical protein
LRGTDRPGLAAAVAHGASLGLPVALLVQFGHNALIDRRIRKCQVLLTGLRNELPSATQLACHAEDPTATRDLIRSLPATILAWAEFHHWRVEVDLVEHKGDGRGTPQGKDTSELEHRKRNGVGAGFPPSHSTPADP